MNDAHIDLENTLTAAHQWEADHVPDDLLDGWMSRSKDMLTDKIKLKAVRKQIDETAKSGEDEVPIERVRQLLPDLYCVAYCFHLHTGSPLLSGDDRHTLAQLHAWSEVTRTQAHYEAMALGRWG